MELISFILMMAVPLAWLMWGLSKKGFFAAVALPPLIFLFYAVAQLNTDPVISIVQSDYQCVPIVDNATITEGGNFTSYGTESVCSRDTASIDHNLSPVALQTINYTMSIGLIGTVFLVAKRLLEKVRNGRLEE